jgi:hypothetical protein
MTTSPLRAIPIADVPDADRTHLLHPERVPLELGLDEAQQAIHDGAVLPAARLLAACCHAVYHPQSAADAWYASRGLELLQRVEQGGARVDLLRGHQQRILVCCGTRPDEVANLRQDADAVAVPHPRAGRVHRGFATALEAVAAALDPQISAPGAPWVFTGHSLGGALAILAAERWHPAASVVFGCPRVGDAAFVASQAGQPLWRWQFGADVVGSLPPQGLGYRHLGRLCFVSPVGCLLVDPGVRRLRRARTWGRLRYWSAQPWFHRGALWVRDLADHSIHNYRLRLAAIRRVEDC